MFAVSVATTIVRTVFAEKGWGLSNEPIGSELNIWRRPTRGGRGPTPSFDRDRLAAAGVELADARGLAAVTMRAVAGALGSKPASLYRYVRTRDEVLELMVDRVNGEILLDGGERGWREGLLAVARGSRDCYLRHPWLLEALAAPMPMGPSAIAYLEHVLTLLEGLPQPPGRRLEAIAVMNAVTAALVRSELMPQAQRRMLDDLPDQLLPSADNHPSLTAALLDANGGADTPEKAFDRIVGNVIAGLLG